MTTDPVRERARAEAIAKTPTTHTAHVTFSPPRVIRCPCGCGRRRSASSAVFVLIGTDAPVNPEEG